MEATLQKLLAELEAHRYPLSTEARHALFRSQPERRLESLVREDVSRFDPLLDSRFASAQVMAATGGEHVILDVLSVTRSGRPAILELTADEGLIFLLQAAKYWLHPESTCSSRTFRVTDFLQT
jgi:hypothetical protein